MEVDDARTTSTLTLPNGRPNVQAGSGGGLLIIRLDLLNLLDLLDLLDLAVRWPRMLLT